MKLRTLSVLSLALLATALTNIGARAQQAGSGFTCATCHPAEAASEPRTPMGRAMELPGADPELASHPKLTFHLGAFTYTVETHGDSSAYSVTDGVKTINLPIQWNFGEGAQTWVLVHNGHYYESLVSYYPKTQSLDITTGDEQLKPKTLEEAVGRELSSMDVKACFGCHSTDAVFNGKLTLPSLKPGVTCEHCHVGSQAHLYAEALGENTASAPPSLGRLNSEDISNFCGQCHRTWQTVVRSGWHGLLNVRFQPYRLANSRCFDGTDPRISCLACHDPHQTVVRDDASYDPKCLACHGTSSGTRSTGSLPKPSGAKSCPVAKSNCASCHMPSVPIIRGLMVFHDHEIRIVRPGEPYPD